ncbi:DsbA family protein [Desulfovibrio sp. JC022]|uniref:DsbA family protein n=1 Tax=Desulfovibrio sp. JC022 TaxID=2593642 RepID=UPI0013D0B756|nr:DsbA family protein [Desulfovibrio sp. JC022]NDV22412.1 disulfide bond formation protein DsbA [Desulfovibrio sp. JC022]
MLRLALTFFLTSVIIINGQTCQAEESRNTSKEEIRRVLKNNPDMIFDALKGHEEELYDMLQIGLEKKNKSRIRAGRLKQLQNPKKAALHPDRPVWGSSNGKINIIVFSDFQSASSAKADKVIHQLLKKHPNINYRFRHNPLGLHKMSLPAARYYEALAIQDQAKAKKLNQLLLKNRLAIKKNGTKKLNELAEKCGADMAQLHRTLNSPQVKARIEGDRKEARKLGLTASPVFLVNGVIVTGAAPLEEFEEVLRMIRSN